MSESVYITVKFVVPGFHRWPEAWGNRAYLSDRHRHLFHVAVTLGVTHDERDVEFHDLLDEVRAMWPEPPDGDLGRRSCETLARHLVDTLTARHPGRAVSVSVFEDGEVGATVSREPSR